MTRLCRAVLLLYPARFRRRYGEEIAAAVDEERRALRKSGAIALFLFWLRTAVDIGSSASRQRFRQLTAWLRPRPVRGAPQLPAQSRRTQMDTLRQDLRYALRQFARRPGFTAVAVLSLALGIGGNSLMYGLVDGFVLHPFPYPDPDRLVAVGLSFPKLSSETTYVEAMSPAEYADFRGSRSFVRTAAFDLGNRNVSGGDVPQRLFTALLLDDPFPVIGMNPALGRGFTRDELGPNGARVAIISHRLWQSRFGGDPRILGRSIRIGGEPASIVGVMPRGLLLIGTDLWIPWGGDVSQVPRNVRQFSALARLAPGVTLQQANAELAAVAAAIDSSYRGTFKEYDGWRLIATPWAAALLRDARPAAYVLLGAVAFVLLIACVNLTNLFLARSTTRQRELAVRLALGAARWRLVRHMLTETLLVAASGAAGGLLLAYAGLKASAALIPAQLEMLDLHAGLSVRVLLWSLALTALAGVLVGILPSLQAARTDPHESLKADARAGSGRAGTRLRHTLIVSEIALSVVLLLGAGLLMRSFLNLQRVDLGFDPRGVLTMRLTLPQQKYRTGEAITAFFEELVRRVDEIPGVTAAATASQFPPEEPFSGQVEVEGTDASGAMLPTANTTIVSRDFFRALGVHVTSGDGFGPSRADGVRQVVVNEAFAARYLSGRQAVGGRLRLAGRGSPGSAAPWTEIVGVVGNMRNNGVASVVRPEVFIPMEQGRDTWNQLFLLVRSDNAASAVLASVRQVVAALDPEQPVYAIQTLEDALSVSTFQARVSTLLIGVFASVALLLAAVGIYGVMSYSVTARTQELGVRLAVGAQRRDVMWIVLGQVLRLSALGLAIGVVVLLVSGRAFARLLFGVEAADPLTIAGVAAALGAVALAAAWAPAFRASRIDPLVALRYE